MKTGRVLAGMILTAILAVSPGIVVLAEEPEVSSGEETQIEREKTPEEIAAEEQARKTASYEAEVDSNLLSGWAQGPKVYAASAIVMDMESGAVLYAKKAEEQHFPASITKLLTTLVALEEASLVDPVVFSESSISFLQYDDANIGMKPGEQISMNDALYAVLLASANEVSYAVAENVGNTMGGGYETFIRRMNERAIELGCTGSHWVNANGLHDDAHYTTAHDMARIAAAVYQREEFRTIMGNLEYRIPPTNLVPEERVFQQNHKMLWPENDYYYEYCRGGKTGYTDQSGTTLVTMADNGIMRLAAVVMADYGVDAYVDTRAMLEYAFANFQKVPIVDKETSQDIASFSDESAYVVLPAGIAFSQLESEIYVEETAESTELQGKDIGSEEQGDLSRDTESGDREIQSADPIREKQESPVMGRIVYRYGGQEVGHAKVALQPEFFEEKKPQVQEKPEVSKKDTSEEQAEENQTEIVVPIRELAVAVAAALVILSSTLYFIKHKRRKDRRRRSRRSME